MFKQRNHGAKKTNGRASKLENAVFLILKAREQKGEIKEIKEQQVVVLQEGKRIQRITWRIDFSFVDCKTDELNYCEAKGFATDVYKLKLKLYRANPPAPLEVWKGNWTYPVLAERIERAA